MSPILEGAPDASSIVCLRHGQGHNAKVTISPKKSVRPMSFSIEIVEWQHIVFDRTTLVTVARGENPNG